MNGYKKKNIYLNKQEYQQIFDGAMQQDQEQKC